MSRPIGPATSAVKPSALAELPQVTSGAAPISVVSSLSPSALRVNGSPGALPRGAVTPRVRAPASVDDRGFASLDALATRVLAAPQASEAVREMMRTVIKARSEERALMGLRLIGTRA